MSVFSILKRRHVLAAAVMSGLFTSAARADFQITTYWLSNGQLVNFQQADELFAGLRPSRFVNTGATVDMVDLFENGGIGQFPANRAIPGLDQNFAAGDTDDFVTRATGTLTVGTGGVFDFWTDSDDGARLRVDLNRNGVYDVGEDVVPASGLQGAGTPERSPTNYTLTPGNYNFEFSFFERGGGASGEAGYRPVTGGTPGSQFLIGDAGGGVGLQGNAASLRTVGALTVNTQITNFAQADALIAGALPGQPGFPVSEFRNVFNIVDSGGDGDFLGGQGAPGLGAPDSSDDEDFVAVGRGLLVIPAGGISGAVFRSNTDDGGRLRIDMNGDGDFNDAGEVVINDDVLAGPHNFDSAPVTLGAGNYLVEYAFFERGGGAEGEVSVRLTPTGPFILLGNEAGGGLDVIAVPEPAALGLVALTGLALGRRRRHNH
jgi:MYXO-CTERM domain-containing protein